MNDQEHAPLNSTELAEILFDRPADVEVRGLEEGGKVGTGGDHPPSPHVLELDRWSKRRGETISDEWASQELGEYKPPVVADATAAMFSIKPKLAENPACRERAQWWSEMMTSPEYRSLHRQTCLNPMLSSLAAYRICKEWEEYFADLDDEDADPGSDDEPIGPVIKRIRSTAEAVAEAQDDLDAVRSMASLDGGKDGRLNSRELVEQFRRIRDSTFLRSVLELAGRMQSRGRSLQKQKLTAPRDEITGLELGGDVAKLLASEQMQVAGAIPELETMALYRLAQKRMLCYRHRRAKPVMRGPIVVGVDESGSMEGKPIIAAKALALAMAWLAQHQGRWFCAYSFSGQSNPGVYCVRQPQVANSQGELLDWVEHFYYGGTASDVPLSKVPRKWWPKWIGDGLVRGKTDHIVITDANLGVSEARRNSYNAWAAEEQVKTYGIILNDSGSSLRGICDRMWIVNDLTLQSEAVEQLLGI